MSPAKTLDFSQASFVESSQIRFFEKSSKLIEDLQGLSSSEIALLMGISDKLASTNFERFQNWGNPSEVSGAKQALLAFKGDVYRGFDTASVTSETLQKGQDKVRILSGLYGCLRPLDLILPYRLEMGTKFSVDGYKNLYDFWSADVTESLKKEVGDSFLLNLASQEYFKVIDLKTFDKSVVSVKFLDDVKGSYKTVAVYAKVARGAFSRWCVEKNITSIDELKHFSGLQYSFSEFDEATNTLIFKRLK